MAVHALSDEFKAFFAGLNPPFFQTMVAALEHDSVRAIIEDPNQQCAVLKPTTFLQG